MIISSSLIEFAYLNLALGVFNLLPFSRLDGGSILLIILENIFPEKNTHQIIKIPAIIILLCNIAYIIIIRDINIINIVFILYPISEITDK
jgi:Zn-dependent protease